MIKHLYCDVQILIMAKVESPGIIFIFIPSHVIIFPKISFEEKKFLTGFVIHFLFDVFLIALLLNKFEPWDEFHFNFI